MTKDIRKEFRKLVIMGSYPGMNYEEALKSELTLGCQVKDKDGFLFTVLMQNYAGNYLCQLAAKAVTIKRTIKRKEIKKIIGLPITIGRVMQVLGKDFAVMCTGEIRPLHYHKVANTEMGHWLEKTIVWKLIECGRECTDDDQSDITLKQIIQLLRKKNEKF